MNEDFAEDSVKEILAFGVKVGLYVSLLLLNQNPVQKYPIIVHNLIDPQFSLVSVNDFCVHVGFYLFSGTVRDRLDFNRIFFTIKVNFHDIMSDFSYRSVVKEVAFFRRTHSAPRIIVETKVRGELADFEPFKVPVFCKSNDFFQRLP